MPTSARGQTEGDVLKSVAESIGTTEDQLEYSDVVTPTKTVAVYMSVPFRANIFFKDGSNPEPGDWVYLREELPFEESEAWEATADAVLRFIDRK